MIGFEHPLIMTPTANKKTLTSLKKLASVNRRYGIDCQLVNRRRSMHHANKEEYKKSLSSLKHLVQKPLNKTVNTENPWRYQIDFIINKRFKNGIKNCKTLPGADTDRDHNLLVADQ
ncbi:hypothetical protein J437_LFUL006551 [Ladona fulva]|uniref:Uncharacterized protein n=1 Tax=Ladona fulva TaxID=123851 RepID=A0A8K0KGM0_LADFU|nr:hypothetical protein J437_LFUL006551 [Ladona fulva]